MSRPQKHPKTSVYYFREKVPADLRSAFGRTEVSRSLRTKEPTEAKARHAEEKRKQALVWQSMRAVPEPIPHKTLMALVGDDYSARNAMLEEEPGTPEVWSHVIRLGEAAASSPEGMERWYGDDADHLLREAGLAADATSRARLLEALHTASQQWAENQHKRARGDYSPDPNAGRFPVRPRTVAAKLTLGDAFGLWEREHLANGKSPRTVVEFRRKIDSLRNRLGHDDAGRVTPEDLIAWCDHLRFTEGLKAKTVADGYLTTVKAVFEVARLKRRLPSNPAKGVKVAVPKPIKLRDRGFTNEEAAAILAATLADPATLGRKSPHLKLAIRWVPWLCAYTGARVTEMTQLRREDVVEEDGVLSIRITPEAGAVKTGNARVVPLHLHLIEMGFPAFVRGRPGGPLFHAGKSRKGREADPLTLARNMGKKVGEWVREEVGVRDEGVWPNYGWRHRFKTLGRRAGLHPEELDALQGHEDGRASSGYGM